MMVVYWVGSSVVGFGRLQRGIFLFLLCCLGGMGGEDGVDEGPEGMGEGVVIEE